MTDDKVKEIKEMLARYGNPLAIEVIRACEIVAWLEENVIEEPFNPKSLSSEYPDTRLRYALPKDLMSWTDFTGQISFGDAVIIAKDNAERKKNAAG